MQRWCALLEEEVSAWPGVSSRPMFGLIAFYRRDAIFAAIPRTRAVDTPFSLLLKLPAGRNARLKPGGGPGGKWVTFALESEGDISEALRLLQKAYERAGGRRQGASAV